MAQPDVASGEQAKLTISPCTVESSGNISVDDSKPAFKAVINPSDYKHGLTIEYNQAAPQGAVGTNARFSAMGPESVSIQNLVLDGTGVADCEDMSALYKQLYDVIYKYDGTNHEPNVVRLLWGSLIFFGRAKSIEVNYTLFKPNGVPLRAKVGIKFIGWSSDQEASLKAARSSPDLSHVVEIRAGDSLPLLCHRIYGSCGYYMEVAKINGINHFRDLKPGTKLHFPPLG